MEEFATQAEEKMEHKEISTFKMMWKNSEEREESHSRLLDFLEGQLQNQCLEYTSQNSAYLARPQIVRELCFLPAGRSIG